MLSAYQGEDAATDLTSGTAKLLRVIIKKLVTNIQTEIHSFFPFFFFKYKLLAFIFTREKNQVRNTV